MGSLNLSMNYDSLFLKFIILKALFCSFSNFLKIVLFLTQIWQKYIKCVQKKFCYIVLLLLSIPIALLSLHLKGS